jgi:hypothetical protein
MVVRFGASERKEGKKRTKINLLPLKKETGNNERRTERVKRLTRRGP